MLKLTAEVPSENGRLVLRYRQGLGWECSEPHGDDYGDSVASLLDTYMVPTVGDHHGDHPDVFRAMVGLSVVGGRLVRAPAVTPLPEGAIQ